MSGDALSGWDVRLSRRAEAELRALEPVARAAVARALDRLTAEGLAGRGTPDPRDARASLVEEGPLTLRVVHSPSRQVLLVVDIRTRGGRSGRPGGRSWGDAATDLLTDARVATRGLRRAPTFTLAVVATLALGLGGGTAILGLVHTVYRAALPFEDGDALLRLRSRAEAATGERVYNMSPRDFHAIRDGNRVFTGVVAMGGGSLAALADDGASRLSAISVSEGWAGLLGIRPILGRTFTAEEEALGGDADVVLVSHGVWERFLEDAPDLTGRLLATDEGAYQVIGVLPPRFAYPYDADVWRPGRFDRAEWQAHDLNVVARVAPGMDEARVREDMARLYGGIREASPGTAPDAGVHVATVRQDFIRNHADALRGLGAAVVFLLVLACANVGTLLTIRMVDRERETVLRAVLGASRGRVVRLVVVEAAVLFLAGGVAGLGVAVALGSGTEALIPDVFRTQLDLGRVRFDPVVVAGALAFALSAGILTGAVAALRASRRDLVGALRSGARGGPDRATGRSQNLLVTGQVALALALLLGAGVLFRHFEALRTSDLGYRTERVVTVQVAVDVPRYADPRARLALLDALEQSLVALPEAESVGITSVNPLCCGDWGASIRVEGLERAPDAPPILIHHGLVTEGYFEAMGIPVLRGRGFGREDGLDTPPAVVVDERLADRLWPGQDPIGKRLGPASGELRTVVGVVPRVHREGDFTEGWYLPMRQEPTARSTEILHLMIRSRAPGALQAARRAVAEVDPALATFGEATLTSLRTDAIGQDRIGAILSAAFAGVGLLLACLGLYGLLAYRVTLQSREIGTRLALGARRAEVVRLILGRSVGLLAAGVAAGGVLGWTVNRILTRTVEGVEMAPFWLVAAMAGVLSVATLAAAAVPALRAAQLDPARTVQASG